MHNDLLTLPQSRFIPQRQIDAFVERVSKSGDFHDLPWHVGRLRGLGGSEIGTLTKHLFPQLRNTAGQSFKSPHDIIDEKLLIKMPNGATKYTKRGNGIEPLTQRVMELVTQRLGKRHEEAKNLSQVHSTHSFMRGEIDDAFILSNQKVLVDYKSSVLPYSEVPFDHHAQLNYYSAIAKSNGLIYDKAYICGIHAPEETMQALAVIAQNRQDSPDDFELMAQLIADKKLPATQFKTYPINLSDKLMDIVTLVAETYWNNYVLKGERLEIDFEKTLSPNELKSGQVLMNEAAKLLALQKVVATKLAAVNKEAESLFEGVNSDDIPYLKESAINLSKRTTINKDKALEMLEFQGADPDIALVNGKVNVERLISYATKQNPDFDLSPFYDQTIDTKALKIALQSYSIDLDAVSTTSINFATSTAKRKKALFEELVEDVENNPTFN